MAGERAPETTAARIVAAFDLDGTLTRRDTLAPFLARACGPVALARAVVALSLRLLLALTNSVRRDEAKEALLVRLLAGRRLAPLADLAEDFAAEVVASGLRPDVVEHLERHRVQGHRLVIVSASPELYVGPLGRRLGVDAVLATRLEVDADGRLTGRLAGPNCRAAEKEARLREHLGAEPVTLFAYGDSAGDRELLAMADTPLDVGRPPRRLGLAGRALALYVASRLVVLSAAAVAARLVPERSLGSVLEGWDSGWYLRVAMTGYPDDLPIVDGQVGQNELAFFPLYPLAIRLAHAAGISSWLRAGLFVAFVSGAVAAVLLWRLLARVWGPEAADRGTALFCFFPGSFVFSMAYAEPLMLALGIGCLLALLDRRWLVAGVLAGLATACRPNAAALIGACAWAAAVAVVKRREWRALVAPLLAPTGLVAFLVFVWSRTGRADAWMRTQAGGWGERIDATATWDKISRFVERPFEDTNIAVAVLGTVFLALTLAILLRARPPGVVVAYTLGIVALSLLSQTLGARPRFVLTAFPLVAVLGRFGGVAFPALLGASAVTLGSFTVMSLSSLWATP